MKFSLQINLSPGDVHYASLTVPALISAHQDNVDECLLVVDCTKPERTKLFNPDVRCAEPAFSRRVEQITTFADELLKSGAVDRVVVLRDGNEAVAVEARRNFVGRLIHRTHDYGGCGLLSYFVGLQAPNGRFVIHYDADILLYQAAGFHWPDPAVQFMEYEKDLVFATPRISPPPPDHHPDGPSLTEGRPFHAVCGGWTNDWFSTRCFVVDMQRLRRYLPLNRGRLFWETAAVKILRRGYPRSPEIMFFRTVGGAGGRRLNLSTRDAWYLHPSDKGTEFQELLPEILESVSRGVVPDEQRGYPEVNLSAWRNCVTRRSTSGELNN